MKIAVVGSRNLTEVIIDNYIPSGTKEIVSGGAAGVDSCAAEYARENGLKLAVFLPEYKKYGRRAPIVRNKQIVDYADKVIVFWDGSSKGTESVIKYAEKQSKPLEVVIKKPSPILTEKISALREESR